MYRKVWAIGHKKTYHSCYDEGLNLWRKRPQCRAMAAHRVSRPKVSDYNICWSMVFVADSLFNGQRIRTLTVVDNFSR